MATPLIPQEIFLLERYTSVEYFEKLRDTWAEMIAHLDRCLDEFMRNLPLDYRARSLPEQPDAVWGERVIPNFRDTLQSLNDGYVKLVAADFTGLEHAHGPLNDFKGQTDFWSGWMTHDNENIYGALINKAVTMAGNIVATEGAYWNPQELTTRYDDQSLGLLDVPTSWPTYKLSSTVIVSSGEPLLKSGIYLPDIDNSCAEFLGTAYDTAPDARIYTGEKELFAPDTGIKYGQEPIYSEQPCKWFLVERTYDSGISTTPNLLSPTRSRVVAGTPCPQSGVYFTPAKENSRRRFVKGEIMPSFDSVYGATIWQWDDNQS
jgi:hypothetical protein